MSDWNEDQQAILVFGKLVKDYSSTTLPFKLNVGHQRNACDQMWKTIMNDRNSKNSKGERMAPSVDALHLGRAFNMLSTYAPSVYKDMGGISESIVLEDQKQILQFLYGQENWEEEAKKHGYVLNRVFVESRRKPLHFERLTSHEMCLLYLLATRWVHGLTVSEAKEVWKKIARYMAPTTRIKTSLDAYNNWIEHYHAILEFISGNFLRYADEVYAFDKMKEVNEQQDEVEYEGLRAMHDDVKRKMNVKQTLAEKFVADQNQQLRLYLEQELYPRKLEKDLYYAETRARASMQRSSASFDDALMRANARADLMQEYREHGPETSEFQKLYDAWAIEQLSHNA